ncbi:Zn(II)2Cys6 transcription factor [Aspergillus melleus]|uniref:Zn(II)2Cys6 transcription factor n=1 Tax=Aspergillus melleus TaxID=138277 RepID=UPI001E8DE7E5|nr:uncharacterized protein LDX57_002228 [Aspergillus melleus]KAH8424477.1 hypothetical protein LDX57_002228 [Aspergillus melleus]
MADSDQEETIHARKQRLSLVPRACEGCRLRKIRCDRSNPCSNCRSLKIACQRPGDRAACRPKSDRVPQLQEHVQRLEERLRVVEDELLSRKTPGAAPEPRPQPDFRTDTVAVYEGPSSFATQSIQATEAFHKTTYSDGNVDASFRRLQDLLRPSTTSNDYRFSRNVGPQPAEQMTLLPVELILTVLRKVKVQPPVFLSSYLLNDADWVERICQKIYFPTEAVSLGELSSMHGVLYIFLREFILLRDPLCDAFDLKKHAETCRKNFNLGIESYELLVVPRFENIFALALGGIISQDEGNPFLSSTMFGAAARSLQLLGYHREIMYLNRHAANARNMRRLFWTVYTFDRNVSLLMGRASCLQDIEIDTSHPELSADPAARPWDESFIMGIKMARLQGQIYSRLYSTAALAGDPAERAQHIRELATELHQWFSELKEIDGSQVNHPQIYQLSRKNWDILYYSSLTSTLRASSASGSESEINSDCFKAARLALHGHLDCMPAYDETGYLSSVEYANWMLASSSFTPFLVIFLHATSATSWSDLELLDQVVSSMERIRSASRACERLYQICATFARLARGLMQTHSSRFGIYTDEDDTLRFFNGVGQTSIFHPESIQGILDSETVDYLTAAEADDMTSILGNWASGQPLGMDLFGFSE